MATRASAPPRPIVVDDRLLRSWPLPALEPDDDKEDRGRALVVAGCASMPGAAILVAEATLRAGAGKVRVATARTAAAIVAAAIPESLVEALPTGATAVGRFLVGRAAHNHAIALGPGMAEDAALRGMLRALLAEPTLARVPLLLDAAALSMLVDVVGERPRLNAQPRLVLTPHAGEMARVMGCTKAAVLAAPERTALACAARFSAVVALKGAATFVATPAGQLHVSHSGNVGLAAAGSGDVLAGIILGFLCRGATPQQAVVWGVHLHGKAGEALARRIGPIGFLTRELAGELPALMARCTTTRRSRRRRTG